MERPDRALCSGWCTSRRGVWASGSLRPSGRASGLSTFQHNRTWPIGRAISRNSPATLGSTHFGVAGISGGGPYAAACAALLPSRVTAAALISPVGPLCPPEGPDTIGMTRYVTFRLLPRINIAMKGVFSARPAAVPECAGFHVRPHQEAGLRRGPAHFAPAGNSQRIFSTACRKACGRASVASCRRCGFSASLGIYRSRR